MAKPTATQYILHPEDEDLGAQQFHNAHHYVDHDGFPEWYELSPEAVAHVNPVLSQPKASASTPANGGLGVPLSSFLK